MVFLWFCIRFTRCPSSFTVFTTLVIGVNLRFCLCKYHLHQHILILCRLHTVKPIFTNGCICPASHCSIGNQVYHVVERTVKHKAVFIILLFTHLRLLFTHITQLYKSFILLIMQVILQHDFFSVNTHVQDFFFYKLFSCIARKFCV